MKKLVVSLLSVVLIGIIPFRSNSAPYTAESIVHQIAQDSQSKKISFSDLPQAVQRTLKSGDYSTQSISSIYQISSSGKTFYSVTFEAGQGQSAQTVTFDEQGNKAQTGGKGQGSGAQDQPKKP